MVPEVRVRAATVSEKVWRSRVPPLRVRSPLPMALSAPERRVPALTVVRPV